jgi:hypothetical protein
VEERRLYDGRVDKLIFWVHGECQAGRKELNKLNQLFGSSKISKSKQATKPGRKIWKTLFAFSKIPYNFVQP